MKKIIFTSFLFFVISLSFSQNYIGKTFMQIVIQEKYVLSPDSTESWERKNIYVDTKPYKKENKILIHDTENFKVTSCIFSNDTCISFYFVYYNLSKKYVENLLFKKYNYNGKDSWVYITGSDLIELCLKEEPGSVFVVEACYLISNKKKNKDSSEL